MVKELLVRGKEEGEVEREDEDMELSDSKEEDLDELAFNGFNAF
jgi:hypothetical protein